MKRLLELMSAIFLVFLCFILPSYAQTADGETAVPSELKWPRVIETSEAKIVIYQPQLENFSENRIQSRFAASVQGKNKEEPVFGAVWMEARIETNRDERMVRLVAIENVRSRFPDATAEQEQWFADVLSLEIPKWNIVLSIDQLVTGLEVEQDRLKTEQALNNDPPEIIYVDKPAALVIVDGDPILKSIENTELMAVINTPFPMIFRKADKTYYLIGKDAWYMSREISGRWQETNNPPADVATLEREPSDDADAESAFTAGIVVFGATKPTELLSVEGDPQFMPFPGNNLMVVKNTDNDLLFEIDTSSYYLLLSGRWFKSKKLDGSWSYVPPDSLPESFTEIPAESDKGELRAGVPGTEEALDAVLDAQIPETATVNRSEAKLTVIYDGDPEFELIKGTGIDYALNTATPVIRVKGKYYAVDNGIWFTAAGPNGPWIVADSVPTEVQDIPPSSPVNNIKYVYVYDSTPEVVYVGYTPGYTGCYIHHGVVVYGTGYYYRPWYRHYYYPRHCTYGFSVRYSSYYGWSFGYSYYHGPFSFHFGYAWGPPCWGGWWGPPWYRPPYYRPPHYRPSRPPRPPRPEHPIAKPKPPIAKPPGKGKPAQLPAGQRPVTRPASGDLYDRRPDKSTGDRTRPATMDRKDNVRTGKPALMPNDVFTDKNGNVFRKGRNGWEQRQDGQWRPQTQRPAQQPSGSVQKPARLPSGPVQRPGQQPAQRPAQQPSTRPSPGNARPSQSIQTRPSTPQRQNPTINNRRSLDSQQLNRSRGNQRTGDFYQNRQRSTPGNMKSPGGNGRNRR
ncbi:MAG: carbohydrate-binding family V/XII [Desulfatitalea sp.]|nr:hypothetical protein [Desulfatitalea sp.]NNK01267.1 carbohydrate-binding family V/XII [Desulfatitalea sp.]